MRLGPRELGGDPEVDFAAVVFIIREALVDLGARKLRKTVLPERSWIATARPRFHCENKT